MYWNNFLMNHLLVQLPHAKQFRQWETGNVLLGWEQISTGSGCLLSPISFFFFFLTAKKLDNEGLFSKMKYTDLCTSHVEAIDRFFWMYLY